MIDAKVHTLIPKFTGGGAKVESAMVLSHGSARHKNFKTSSH